MAPLMYSFICRYDVKYGSAGFNPHGYAAGCAFAAGDAAGVRAAEPLSGVELCEPSSGPICDISNCSPVFTAEDFFDYVSGTFDPGAADFGEVEACIRNLPPACSQCVTDHTTVGHCFGNPLDDGLSFPRAVRPRPFSHGT